MLSSRMLAILKVRLMLSSFLTKMKDFVELQKRDYRWE